MSQGEASYLQAEIVAGKGNTLLGKSFYGCARSARRSAAPTLPFVPPKTQEESGVFGENGRKVNPTPPGSGGGSWGRLYPAFRSQGIRADRSLVPRLSPARTTRE